MSEYQQILFRAIDTPVSQKNLEYMRKQSSRAEVTPWSFDNEYHFGDFGGNAMEMLRRGYDLHLHYANFGIRTLMIRLPQGLPDPKAAKPYFLDDSLKFVKDKTGPGGILVLQPSFEDLDEIDDVESLADELKPLRAEIMEGDLRPLYLLHMAVACDCNHGDESVEPPVPAGLGNLSSAQQALAEWCELDDDLILAAAQNCPPAPVSSANTNSYAAWIQQQSDADRNEWLCQLLADPQSSIRRDLLAKFRQSLETTVWPTIKRNRPISELLAAAADIHNVALRAAEAKSARARAKHLASIAADPSRILAETVVLVAQKSTTAYEQIAALLADLREALAGTEHSDLAENQARKLKASHPSSGRLIACLRRNGFLPK